MFGGIDPRKMQGMMKKLGMSQEDIPASRVVIEKHDGNIVIDNPSIVKIKMQGQESFQITGDVSIEEGESVEEKKEKREEDIKTIMEKTGKKKEEAEKALDKEGDLAEAIIKLSD